MYPPSALLRHTSPTTGWGAKFYYLDGAGRRCAFISCLSCCSCVPLCCSSQISATSRFRERGFPSLSHSRFQFLPRGVVAGVVSSPISLWLCIKWGAVSSCNNFVSLFFLSLSMPTSSLHILPLVHPFLLFIVETVHVRFYPSLSSLCVPRFGSPLLLSAVSYPAFFGNPAIVLSLLFLLFLPFSALLFYRYPPTQAHNPTPVSSVLRGWSFWDRLDYSSFSSFLSAALLCLSLSFSFSLLSLSLSRRCPPPTPVKTHFVFSHRFSPIFCSLSLSSFFPNPFLVAPLRQLYYQMSSLRCLRSPLRFFRLFASPFYSSSSFSQSSSPFSPFPSPFAVRPSSFVFNLVFRLSFLEILFLRAQPPSFYSCLTRLTHTRPEPSFILRSIIPIVWISSPTYLRPSACP